MNTSIFEPSEISTIKLKCRIIRSATHEGLADENGYPTDLLLRKYEALAKNDVGCIITGYAGVMKNGKGNYHNMLMIDNDSYISHYKQITERIHEYQTPIILQIAHCGRQTRSKITGLPTVAPSPIKDQFFTEDIPVELSESDIEEVINHFVQGIVRAKKAGFDGVQLHLAHGYLLSQFLSSHTNRRTDKWGGSTENKFRIISEIFIRAKQLVGNYPILVKLNGHDGRKKGMTITEAVEIARMLEAVGCAAIEVSCGVYEDGLYTIRGDKLPLDALFKYNFKYNSYPNIIKKIAKPVVPLITKKVKPYQNYNVDAATEIKKNVTIPVIVVGGIKSVEDIKAILSGGKADYVSMCRPFIIEPNIVKKFKDGTQLASKCIDCNYCMIALEKNTLRCYRGKLD